MHNPHVLNYGGMPLKTKKVQPNKRKQTTVPPNKRTTNKRYHPTKNKRYHTTTQPKIPHAIALNDRDRKLSR